jgi:prepilin-type N-terminal cleavage/methylation domain-containing protein
MRNQKGFGLIETMVSIAILTIAMAATTAYILFSSRQNARLMEQLARMDLERQMTSALTMPTVCAAQLASPNVAAPMIFDPALIKPNLPQVLKLLSLISSTDPKAPAIATLGGAVAPTTPGFTVSNLKLNVTSSSTAVIEVDFASTVVPRAIAPLLLPLTIQTTAVAGNKLQITGCLSGSSPDQICQSLGGTYNAAATPQCQMSVTCPSGQVASGTTCVSINSLVAQLCPSGTILESNGSSIKCISPPTTPAPAPAPAPVPVPVPGTPPPATPTPKYCPVYVNTNVVCSSTQTPGGAYWTIATYYENIIGRCGETTGFNFWVNTYNTYVSQGQTSAQALANIQQAFYQVVSGGGATGCSPTCAPAATQYPACTYSCTATSATCNGQ